MIRVIPFAHHRGIFFFIFLVTMKQQLEEEINELHKELIEYTSLKPRKIISQKELDIVTTAINDDLYQLYRSSIMM